MSFIRKSALYLLGLLGRDINITHHWVSGHSVRLHSYKHKGYWWHGKNREHDEMISAQRLIRPDDTVIEVGGHIGYLSVWFSSLVGQNGKLVVFEPSDENARYLLQNISKIPWAKVDRRGISDHVGEAEFYIENLTGQNNSLYPDYALFDANAALAGVKATRQCVKIQLTTLDIACAELGLNPAFVKIDIEGAEIEALRGMQNVLLASRPIVFIEITKNIEDCFAMFEENGYRAFDSKLHPASALILDATGKQTSNSGDFFFIHEESDRIPA